MQISNRNDDGALGLGCQNGPQFAFVLARGISIPTSAQGIVRLKPNLLRALTCCRRELVRNATNEPNSAQVAGNA